MKNETIAGNLEDQPLEVLLLHFRDDKYKVAYAAIRWAREIKQKESLTDPIASLVTRSLREILTGKISIKDIEQLPVIVKSPPPAPAPAPAAPAHPTITLNLNKEGE
jgi:DNA-directed RNA polymerase subunit K/omega